LPKDDKSTLPDGRTISLCITTFASEQRSKGSPVYVETTDEGVRALTSEAKVYYPGWKLQPQEQRIIGAHIARLVQTNQLRTHRFEEAQPSLQLQTASLIARRTFVRALEESWSFDAYRTHVLMLSLLVCTASRAGDPGWVVEDGPDAALQIREIELHLEPGDTVLANVALQIEINWYKGNRGGQSESRKHTLSTFERQENAILDPARRMIDMLLRHGLLTGTFEEIIARAEAHPSRWIEIGTPENA
jgi:hypothetical protein